MQISLLGSEQVSTQSCCTIWTVWMIIVPNLRWRTFRYWAVRASDVQGIGSILIGDTGQFLYWLWPHYQHKPTLNMQTSFNPSSVASSLQHPCNNNVLRLFLPVSCTKSTINQKEWHVATKRLNLVLENKQIKRMFSLRYFNNPLQYCYQRTTQMTRAWLFWMLNLECTFCQIFLLQFSLLFPIK